MINIVSTLFKSPVYKYIQAFPYNHLSFPITFFKYGFISFHFSLKLIKGMGDTGTVFSSVFLLCWHKNLERHQVETKE